MPAEPVGFPGCGVVPGAPVGGGSAGGGRPGVGGLRDEVPDGERHFGSVVRPVMVIALGCPGERAGLEACQEKRSA